MLSCFQYSPIIRMLNFLANSRYLSNTCVICACVHTFLNCRLLNVCWFYNVELQDPKYLCILWCQILHEAWGSCIFSRCLFKCKLQNWNLCFLFFLLLKCFFFAVQVYVVLDLYFFAYVFGTAMRCYFQELIVLHIFILAGTLEVSRIGDVVAWCMLQPPKCTYNMYSGGSYTARLTNLIKKCLKTRFRELYFVRRI
jgi:hypothetical protein